MTAADAADAADEPTALVATTVNVYAVPFVSPGTTAEVAPAPAVTVAPPGAAVTTNPVSGDPPLDAGAAHDTVACPSPATADTPVGAPGTTAAAGVVKAVSSEATLDPMPLWATTVTVYAVAAERPETRTVPVGASS